MIAEKMLDEFVKRTREAGGANVESILLFGSAVTGDFRPGLSNLNVLCVLRDSSFQALRALTPAAKWWDKQKQPPPLCITRHELERTVDVFTIELLDMQQQHRVLYGEDAVKDLRIPMDLHRVQVEYELREKLVLLRQHILVASDSESRLSELLVRSAPSFTTLFRHALIALGGTPPATRREAVEVLAKRVGFDSSVILRVLDAREKKVELKKSDTSDLAAQYLAAVERVAAAVDAA
jgi:predicted nucleotidyltransferase